MPTPEFYGRADMDKYMEACMNSPNLDKGPLLNSEWKKFTEDLDKEKE